MYVFTVLTWHDVYDNGPVLNGVGDLQVFPFCATSAIFRPDDGHHLQFEYSKYINIYEFKFAECRFAKWSKI